MIVQSVWSHLNCARITIMRLCGCSEMRRMISTVSVGIFPWSICTLPSDEYVYVINKVDNDLSVIRTADNSVAATIDLIYFPSDICSLPSGEYLYAIANSDGGFIRIIRTSDNSVVETIHIGYSMEPMGICSHPSGETVYIVNRIGNCVSVIQ